LKNNKIGIWALKPVHVAVVMTLGVTPAMATAEEVEALPEVSVKAASESATSGGAVEGYVATEARTATKSDGLLIESPQSISVITEQQIVEQGGQTLQDMVRYRTWCATAPA
jgi:iron complex outermembrane receptor protein